MSADLLRRAAVKLRQHAEAATEGPWTVESAEDGESGHVEYLAFGPDDGHGRRVIPFRTKTEDAGFHSQAEADMDYAVLVHPPVALALAELLEFFADHWIDAKAVVHYSARADAQERALRTAREILREPS